jgi:hypothetical protein
LVDVAFALTVACVPLTNPKHRDLDRSGSQSHGEPRRGETRHFVFIVAVTGFCRHPERRRRLPPKSKDPEELNSPQPPGTIEPHVSIFVVAAARTLTVVVALEFVVAVRCRWIDRGFGPASQNRRERAFALPKAEL